MYDIFFIGNDGEHWRKLKFRYPKAQRFVKNITMSELKSRAFTSMFWIVRDDFNLRDNFDLNSYRATKWDNMFVHMFKNGQFFDGLSLIPKGLNISSKEFQHSFYVNKKEIDIVASDPVPFQKLFLNSYEDYMRAINESSTDMFWAIWNDIEIDIDFNFDYQVPKHNQHITHIFKNGEFYDGICLFPKNKIISKKEFDHRFFTEKKEIDIMVSKPKLYDKFYMKTYDEYLLAIESSSTNMFWAIWNDIEIDIDFNFDYQVPKHNQHITHIFKNGEFYDGVCLMSKDKKVTKKEFDHRFFIEKKEIDIVASHHRKYDIVFISYRESFADENYKKLLDKNLSNNIYRVEGIKGIHQAHVEAAKKVSTDLFYVVDADADTVPSFRFDYQIPYYDFNAKNTVFVWRSQNAINGLIYGYGGVKLLPTKLTLNMDITRPDMTTSISKSFKVVEQLSNITAFNTDPFNTWKSAFRECVKLSSKTISGQIDKETEERLDIWCSVGRNSPFGEYAIDGAIAGRKYGEENKNCIESIKKINDFNWLEERFEKTYARR